MMQGSSRPAASRAASSASAELSDIGFRSCAGQERVDVGGELGVMLEKEAVRRIRVDLQARTWNEAGQQIQ
jgi:hypothetical protein